MTLTFTSATTFTGTVRPPSDKSLTHRAYMFGAMASGESVIRHPLRGEDCESTRECLNLMGLRHEWLSATEVRLIPTPEWSQPPRPLDCGNSGTTMRLMSGLIASRPLDCVMIGDASLSRRPMKRIAEPLRLMGATVEGDTPPLHIVGGSLRAIDYVSPVASAQVKSCTLLAGLRASGTTSVTEPSLSRDHTERMLRATGVRLTVEDNRISVEGGQVPSGFEMTIPGDISSAAFLIVGAAIVAGGSVLLQDLSVNPSRTGILDVLDQVGVTYELRDPRDELGEPVADLYVAAPKTLAPFEIAGALVPRLIDEIPVLAVLATQCEGRTVIRDAREMRLKETDRIEVMAAGLRSMGARVETFEDGMAIEGPTRLQGTHVDATGDHRIAMSFAIAALIANGDVVVDAAESIATSYPTFTEHLQTLTQK